MKKTNPLIIAKKISNSISNSIGVKKATLSEPEFSKNDIKCVTNTILSSYVSTYGNEIKRFENKIAKFTNSKYAVAVVNGTAALHLSLKILGTKKNDEILIPSMTFIATANAISYCNAIPHFVEIEHDNLGIDPIKLEKYLKSIVKIKNGLCINKHTKRYIKGIIPVHMFGHPSKIKEIIKVAKKFNLFVLEDAAEALGSFYKGKHLGTFSEIGILSFNGNKIITTGGGGMILTKNKNLWKEANHLSKTAKVNHQFEFIHDNIGYNYRLPNLNAALGLSQLRVLKKRIKNRRQLFHKYFKAFEKNYFAQIYKEPKFSISNYWLQTLLLNEDIKKHKNFILKHLNNNGYSCRPAWSLIHKLEIYKKSPKMKLKITEDIYDKIINIPSSSFLNEEL